MDEITQLQNTLEAVKRKMELYFMGSEKRLPYREKDEIGQSIRRFRPGKDSVTQFRHQNLLQRLVSLERYWSRTQKAIEEGRYERDLFKADLRHNPKPVQARPDAPATSVNKSREDAAEAAAFLASLKGSESLPKIALRGERKAPESMPVIEQRGGLDERKQN